MEASAARVAEAGPGARLVVGSAMAGVTDRLLETARRAEAGDREGVAEGVRAIEEQHRCSLRDLRADGSEVGRVDEWLRSLRVALAGLRHLGRESRRGRDAVVAFGELLSTELLAGELRRRGVETSWVDPRDLVVTEARPGGARPDVEATRRRVRQVVGERPQRDGAVVVGGFVGASPDGVTTNLGRGGSDLTASLLGAALGAERVELWSDVDGLMTADPRLVPGARHLERVSFSEAAALAQYGAGILHPETLAPAVEAGIPVVLRNSRDPQGSGTTIQSDPPPVGGVRALSCLRCLGRARLRQGRGAARARLLAEALARLEGEGLTPRFLAQSEGTLALLLNGGDLPRVPTLLRPLGEVEVIPALGVVCVVGEAEGPPGAPGGRVLRLLEEETVHLVAGGAGRAQLAIVLPSARTLPVLRRLHAELIEQPALREASEP
jgi:aspartate kinase